MEMPYNWEDEQEQGFYLILGDLYDPIEEEGDDA